MELHLIGHDYKYAAEQSLLTLFPGCKPEYPAKQGKGDRITVRCSKGDTWTTMTTVIHKDGQRGSGAARVATAELTDEPFVTDRHLQRILRQSFFKAALDWGITPPEWGALTGVRPTKLMTNIIREGHKGAAAAKAFRSKYFTSQARADLCVQTARYSMDAEASLPEKGVCLYVGIPFCPTRCAYCSFVSHSVEKSMKLVSPFFDTLMEEIDATAAQVNALGLVPVSIYMGGGTPTTLSAEQLDILLTKLETVFDLSAVRENTVEAGRPDTITMEKLEVLKKHGVSRISVNPQTMSDSVLEAIGRKHTAQDILDAFDMVRKVGGMAINMDLIAGLPTDTPESFRSTMDTVMALAPENITVHTLSLKKGARLMDEGGNIPTPASVKEMVDYSHKLLQEGGYAPYYLYRQKNMSGGFENTGWCKPGYENLYNIFIMEELCSIIAMGAGGSTKLVRPDGKIERIFAPKYPNEYIANIAKTCDDKRKIGDFYGISTD